MQGRGRGSYLGLKLMESNFIKPVQVGLMPVRSETTVKSVDYEPRTSPEATAESTVESHGVHSTWTSLDLLGNRGRRRRTGSKEGLYADQDSRKNKENDPDRTSPLQDIDSAILNVSPCQTLTPNNTTDCSPTTSTSTITSTKFQFPSSVDHTILNGSVTSDGLLHVTDEQVKPVPPEHYQGVLNDSTLKPQIAPSALQVQRDEPQVLLSDVTKHLHISSPQQFMTLAASVNNFDTDKDGTDTTSEGGTSTTSNSSVYVPPHRRKIFEKKPEAYNENVWIYNDSRMEESSQSWRKEQYCGAPLTAELNVVSADTIAESEINWQKWKLQRNFKKILVNLNVDNVVGIANDIKSIVVDSQLSIKFPGVSEVNLIIHQLVLRVLEGKETVEVAVLVCRILNVIYSDEFTCNLREVMKEFRQDIFSSVANKNMRCDNFCLLLGKLCEVGKHETKSFQDSLKQCVIGCLFEWISAYQDVDEGSIETKVKVLYMCELLELTKNIMTVSKRSWLKSCFGKIKNCIFSEKLPREVKESFLDAILRQSLQQTVVNKQPATNESTNDDKHRSVAEHSYKKDHNSAGDSDMYKDVKEMLSELGLENLLEKFQENLIRDSLLRVEKNELKNTLQEAGFAPGAILEIQLFLETKGSVLNSNSDISSSTDTRQQSSSPDDRIRKLESDLQQILEIQESDKEKTTDSEQNMDSPVTVAQERMQSPVTMRSQKMQPVELKEARNELRQMQECLSEDPPPDQVCPRPPPGFFNLGYAAGDQWPVVGSLTYVKEDSPKRQVFCEKREGSSVPNTKVENTMPKAARVKGRGRGRRDNSGSLETSGIKLPNLLGKQELPNNDVMSSEVSSEQDRRPFGSSSEVSSESDRRPFGTRRPEMCFICGAKDHRTAFCKNNKAMFD